MINKTDHNHPTLQELSEPTKSAEGDTPNYFLPMNLFAKFSASSQPTPLIGRMDGMPHNYDPPFFYDSV